MSHTIRVSSTLPDNINYNFQLNIRLYNSAYKIDWTRLIIASHQIERSTNHVQSIAPPEFGGVPSAAGLD